MESAANRLGILASLMWDLDEEITDNIFGYYCASFVAGFLFRSVSPKISLGNESEKFVGALGQV